MDNPQKLATQGTGHINLREYRRGNQKWTIGETGNIGKKQKHNTTQYVCWTPLYVYKQNQRKQDMILPTKNWRHYTLTNKTNVNKT